MDGYLELVTKYADDGREQVKKAVSTALREIGKKNFHYNEKALLLAHEWIEGESKALRWIGKKEVFSPRMIAVAGNGDIYLSTQVDGTAVLAFNAEGNFLNKISYDYKVYSLRTAMGRGRDGKVYAVLRDSVADDGTSVIVELDGRDGHIGDATSFMLRSDGSFYSNVCPGRDCDLVIFGGEGILGYDLGSANIKWKVPAGKLPFSTEGFYPMAALADGRILFLDSNKLHYVPAAQQ